MIDEIPTHELDAMHGIELARLAMREISRSNDEPPASDSPRYYEYDPSWAFDLMWKVRRRYEQRADALGLPALNQTSKSTDGMGNAHHIALYFDGDLSVRLNGTSNEDMDLKCALFLTRLALASIARQAKG